MVTIKEYKNLKKQAKIDRKFLKEMISSFKDIKEGKVRRVR